MRGVAATGFVVGVALTLWFNVQRTGRPGEELYMNHLFPPQLRLAKAEAGRLASSTAWRRCRRSSIARRRSSRGGDNDAARRRR